jgi:exopolysaccharide biosynthesis polyprenyl glycosylphosphotransferase
MQNSTNSHSLFGTACKLFDLLALAFVFWLAADRTAQLSRHASVELAGGVHVPNLAVYVLFFGLWHISLLGTGLYRLLRQRSPQVYSIRVAASVIVAFAVVAALAVPLRLSHVTGIWDLRSWLLASLIVLFSRVLVFPVLNRLGSRAGTHRNVLVVGTNQRALAYAHSLRNRSEMGFNVVGFADQAWAGSHVVEAAGFPVVTDLDSFPDFLRRNVVDEVIICLPLQSQYARALQVAATSAEQGIVTRILGDVFDLGSRVVKREFFDSAQLVTIAPGPRTPPVGVSFKRIFDFAGSLILLVLLSPLFALSALAIRLTSKGPVFFKQDRLGLNKRAFRMIKFRTMHAGAEARQKEVEQLNQTGGPAFKLRNDPRITSVGRILRKLSIDELPQLINVLAGQMSLVGPRPLPLRDYANFSEDWHRRRFSVRPGISGLWQVSGRSDIAFQRWMELDMEYIDRWSFWLDLNILAKTIPAVISGQGAY